MYLSKIAIKNPEFTAMIFILLTAMGVMAFITIPRYENPPLDVPGLNIIVTYPGASPEDMEDIIVDPLEDAVNEIDNITKFTTDIRNGYARLRVEFELTEDKFEKNNEVQEKINALQNDLPESVQFRTIEFSSSNVQILQVALISEHAGYGRLREFAEKLEERIALIQGVKETDVEASPERRVLIDLDYEALAVYKITPSQIVNIIKANNANFPAGKIQVQGKAFNLQTTGPYRSLQEIERTILRSSQNQILRVNDVADVYLSYDTYDYIARVNKERAVFVSAYPKEHVNSLNTLEQIRPILEDFRPELPVDIRLQVVVDQSISIKNKINLLVSSLWQGILVVGLFILLFFNIRASLLVMLAIPFSFLIGLIMANQAAFGLQFMSIAGLIIALGLLVDNAIVVVENVYHFIKEGDDRVTAAIKAVDQVGWAIVSSTATTVVAFVPILQIQNLSGEFIKSLPLTLIFTLLGSLFVALTFTPFLSSRLLKPRNKIQESYFQKLTQRFIENNYRNILDYALRHRLLILGTALLVLATAGALYPVIGVSLFPRDDAPIFAIDVSLSQGSVLAETDKSMQYVESLLDDSPEVDYYISNVGYGNPKVINVILRGEKQTSRGQLIVFLKQSVSFEERDQFIKDLRANFDSYLQATILVKEALLGPPVDGQISIKLFGESLDSLRKIARNVEQIIEQTPGTINLYNPLKNFKNDLRIQINEVAAAQLGVSEADIEQNIRIATSGTLVSEFRNKQNENLDIYVQMKRSGDFLKPSDFQRIYVNSAQGILVPVHQLARLEFINGPEVIKHDMTRRTFAVNADVESTYNVDEVTQEILDKLDRYPWPRGYSYGVAGEFESRSEAFGGLFQSLIIALIGIFSILVLQFRSFVQPLIIFSAIPLSLIGAAFGLFVAGYSFSFTAFLGVISLVGIVVNDSIILIDLTNKYMSEGMPKAEAIRKGAEHRFVPIILTSFTTIGGLLPLTLRGGLFWTPMGWCIIGGLTTSTFLILLVVPVLYDIFTPENSPKTNP